MKPTPRRVIVSLLLALFLFLSLYTFNQRTGYLDSLSSHFGLEFVGAVLKPVKWLKREAADFWSQYVNLVDVREENDRLHAELENLRMELAKRTEDMAELDRLRTLLELSPPEQWRRVGARVIGHRMGPQAVLETVILDKGEKGGARINVPVMTSRGVMGRIVSASRHSSQALLLTDINSRVAVRGETSRTLGILAGKGPGEPLEVLYVPLNASLSEGETLVTSGLAGIYPEGLPVARVTGIRRPDISLFKVVEAEPLVNMKQQEEVLLLLRPEDVPEQDQVQEQPPDQAGVGTEQEQPPDQGVLPEQETAPDPNVQPTGDAPVERSPED